MKKNKFVTECPNCSHEYTAEEEIITFLRAEVAKTATTARVKTPLPLQHIDVRA